MGSGVSTPTAASATTQITTAKAQIIPATQITTARAQIFPATQITNARSVPITTLTKQISPITNLTTATTQAFPMTTATTSVKSALPKVGSAAPGSQDSESTFGADEAVVCLFIVVIVSIAFRRKS